MLFYIVFYKNAFLIPSVLVASFTSLGTLLVSMASASIVFMSFCTSAAALPVVVVVTILASTVFLATTSIHRAIKLPILPTTMSTLLTTTA